MDIEQLFESVDRLIKNLEFVKSLEEEGIPMSDDHRDMILRNIDSITGVTVEPEAPKEDYKSRLIFDVR